MADPGSIYAQILAFSQKQSPWKQDLLRRALAGTKPTADDLDAAVQMCRATHGLPALSAPTPDPMTAHHLPTSSGPSVGTVTLTALTDLEGVNALLPGQTLRFASTGLTSVFGDNGSGKSGYARVLKKLCRVRGSIDPILGDVFDEAAAAPRATVAYRIGDIDQSWSGDLSTGQSASPDELGHVGVYDRAAGSSFFTTTQKVDLLPAGLDLLPRLKDGLDHVGAVLREEEKDDTQAVGFPKLDDATDAGRYLARLTAQTSTAELDAASRWSEADEEQLNQSTVEIARLQSKDPAKLALELGARAGRLESLSTELTKVGKALRDAVAARVAEVSVKVENARRAQALHASTALSSDLLPGTGGEPWSLLWEAARCFSTTTAYPATPFPVLDEAARCVLCQQPLTDTAHDRLRAFDQFVGDEVARELGKATKARDKARVFLEAAVPAALLDGSFRSDEASISEELPARIDAFLRQASMRRDALLALLESVPAEESLPKLDAPPTTALDAQAKADRAAAERMKKESTAEALKTQTVEKAELEARKCLHTGRAVLDAELERLARRERRAAAKKDCSTASLSTLARKLTDQFVTGALVDAFNGALESLGGTHLRVGIESTGAKKGESYTGLVLRDEGRGKAAVGKVLSEGEQRAVALAAFFAELEISPTRSAIVFDDPVTSLDHRWRERVARRLAEEARHRQVIVFSHDPVFLAMLSTSCQQVGVDHWGAHVQREGLRPGHCSEDPPWDTKGVKDRVGVLKKDQVGLAKIRRAGTDEDYAHAVSAFLVRLRKTWERAIEDCLFNGAIRRFEYGVETQRIAQIDVSPSDYSAIEAGMRRCSAWAHDPAQALANPPPRPHELADMVNALVMWVQELRQRRPKQQLPRLTPISVEEAQ
jgi:hypothetical protein